MRLAPSEDILIPNEDILTMEIEPWKGFADGLPAEEVRETFMNVINIPNYCEGVWPFPPEVAVIMDPLVIFTE
jgi:hypothetical protein